MSKMTVLTRSKGGQSPSARPRHTGRASSLETGGKNFASRMLSPGVQTAQFLCERPRGGKERAGLSHLQPMSIHDRQGELSQSRLITQAHNATHAWSRLRWQRRIHGEPSNVVFPIRHTVSVRCTLGPRCWLFNP
jgi:hypothetical protein